jgi:hypothetical protein
VARLGTAGRLSSASFTGTKADIERVNAMRTAMRRLDEAYVAYRQRVAARSRSLGAELEQIKSAGM